MVTILLIKLGHLGDTLLLTPTIDLLAARFPGARIDVMVRGGCEVMLHGHPAVTNLIPIARPEKTRRTAGQSFRELARALKVIAGSRYDYAFSFTESDRAAFWTLLSRAPVRAVNDAYDMLGSKRRAYTHLSEFKWAPAHQVLRDFTVVAERVKPDAEPGPLSFHPQTNGEEVSSALGQTGWRRSAVIHATSRWAFKQWMPERWATVADALKEKRDLPVLFSCGPDPRELEYVETVLKHARHAHGATRGRLSMHQLGLVLREARLFLGVDTVTMHLAAAMQTPTVALFGPSSESSWHPWQVRHELVLGACPCKQAREFVCDKSRPYPCMERIQVEEVLSAAERLLEAK